MVEYLRVFRHVGFFRFWSCKTEQERFRSMRIILTMAAVALALVALAVVQGPQRV